MSIKLGLAIAVLFNVLLLACRAYNVAHPVWLFIGVNVLLLLVLVIVDIELESH